MFFLKDFSPRERGICIVLAMLSLFCVYLLCQNNSLQISKAKKGNDKLYLLNYASVFLRDTAEFELAVNQVSEKLGVPNSWLMAVMFSESRFDASVSNSKGSGAVGLIQWMPKVLKEFQMTPEKMRNLNHVQQLEYVLAYFQNVQKSRNVNYNSLTDFYLAVLYPKAIGKDADFVLYKKPSLSYKLNRGLDFNKDSKVTVSDIDKLLESKYPTAYYSITS